MDIAVTGQHSTRVAPENLDLRTENPRLFGVTPLDPMTYLAVAVGFGATALLASYAPATRATRIDPAEALRWEA